MTERKSYLMSLFVLTIAITTVMLISCALMDLKDELTEIEGTYGIGGKIVNMPADDKPVVAVLYREIGEGLLTIMDYVIPNEAGIYGFLVPEGEYFVVAFEDLNRSFSYDEGELYGYGNEGKPIVANAEQAPDSGNGRQLYDIELQHAKGIRKEFLTDFNANAFKGKSWVRSAVITNLSDPIFIKENGYLGYWKPLTFLREIGVGIYFLEPYDPNKTPILFVHGANGTPIGFGPIEKKLDRTKYQPWFYYYPSGFRIDAIADVLNILVESLEKDYRFRKMVVAAHSMGGLVSRAFIIKNAIEDKHTYIKKLITISTPWGGVNTAKMGVEKSPVVHPNWYDVSPESNFIKHIYKYSLPDEIDFYLMFGVRGDCSLMMANNDGTIEIRSEIDYRAQADAIQVFPYDEDHDSILTSDRVIDQFHKLLEAP